MLTLNKRHLFPLSFPVYAVKFLDAENFIVAGGGGATHSGVLNKLQCIRLDTLEMVGEYSFDQGQDVPMCISAHPQDSILCAGVNETDERIEKGLNQSCRIFKLESQKTGITLEQVDKVKVFDSNNSQHYQVNCHLFFLKLCAFSSDGKFLATASSDGQLGFYSYPDYATAFPLKQLNQDVYDLDFDRLCKKMVVVCAKRLYLYSLHTGEEITIKENPVSNKGTPCVFRACRYGRGATYGYLFIVINQVDKRRSFIAKLNANSLDRELLRVAHSSRPITTFSISDDGRWLAFASSDFGISLMNAESLQLIRLIPAVHQFPITSLTFSPDSTTLISGSVDATCGIMSFTISENAIPSKKDAFKLLIVLIALGFWLFYNPWVLDMMVRRVEHMVHRDWLPPSSFSTTTATTSTTTATTTTAAITMATLTTTGQPHQDHLTVDEL